MVTHIDARDRLQPALLDRLTDDSRPGAGGAHSRHARHADDDPHRVMTKAQMRAAVLRDLSWLFNAVQPLGAQAETHPLLPGCVLNFGLPAISGQLASKLDVSGMEKTIRQAILRFEPRILADTLQVHAIEAESVLHTHNVIEFEIRGHLWAQPIPLEILLRTQLDLEAGQVLVREATGAAGRHPPR